LIRGLIGLGFVPLVWQVLRLPRLVKPSLWVLLLCLLLANVVTVFTVSHEAYWVQAAFFELPQ
jgi:hypothetical protein